MRVHSIITSTLVGAALGLENTALTIDRQKPHSAAPLRGSLVGMSIEHDRWNDWAGSLEHPNEFTYNLLDNLKQKTGVAPTIRLGGGTQDGLIWTPEINGVENVFPRVPDNPTTTKQLFPQCDSGRMGGDWYKLASNLPAGTPFIWGINLKAGNSSEAIAQIRAAEEAFADPLLESVTLESVEIGNEADSWPGKERPTGWDISDYVDQYEQYVNDINKELGESDTRKYQVGSFSWRWYTDDLDDETSFFDTVLSKSTVSVSQHNYSNRYDFSVQPSSIWPWLRSELLTKSNVRVNLTRFTETVKFAHDNGFKMHIGEANSMYAHGQPGVSNAAVAGLWVIDYALHAATLGVDAIHFHAGVGYYYNAWQPIDNIGRNITDYDPDSKRHIQPLYTGFIALADAIGDSGDTWVSEIPVDHDHITAYAIWEKSRLARVMVVNLLPWEEHSIDETRPEIDVHLPRGIYGASHAKLKRLSLPHVGAYFGVTWGGQSWETYSGEVEGEEQLEEIKGRSVRLEASSAVLIYL